MPRFAANLSWLYTELPFLERFEAAARDGFTAVEMLFPYAFDARELRARLDGNGLQLVLFNGPPGRVADARAGRRQSTFVYDAHAHVLHEGGQGAGVNYIMYDGDAAGMLEVNAWCGIDRIAMMSWHGPVCTDAPPCRPPPGSGR